MQKKKKESIYYVTKHEKVLYLYSKNLRLTLYCYIATLQTSVWFYMPGCQIKGFKGLYTLQHH